MKETLLKLFSTTHVLIFLLISLSFFSCTNSIENTIDDAIKNKNSVRICYQKENGETSERTISEIKYTDVYGRSGYIRAYCHLRNDWRTFKISRIKSAEIEGFNLSTMVIILIILYVILWRFNTKVFLFQYTFHKMHSVYGSPEQFYNPVYPNSYKLMYGLSKIRWVVIIVLLCMKFWWIGLVAVGLHILTQFLKENDYDNLQIADREINQKLSMGTITSVHFEELSEQIKETMQKCR